MAENRDAMTVDELREELDEYDALFELQQRASREAIRRWQVATGRHDTFPDLGALLTWLLAQIDGR